MAGDWVPNTEKPDWIVPGGFTEVLPDNDVQARRFWKLMGFLALLAGGSVVINQLAEMW